MKEEIAPRFRKLPAGFTRVEARGNRQGTDKASMGMIEIMGNKYSEVQRNRLEIDKASYNIETFWQWEAKVCEQEVDYYERLLRNLKAEVDAEILQRLAQASLPDVPSNIPSKKLTAD